MHNHFYGCNKNCFGLKAEYRKRGYLLVYNNKQVRQACLRNAIN